MITRFGDNFNFDNEFTAEIAQDKQIESNDDTVKIHIPLLMPNIVRGGSGFSILNVHYHRIFANSQNTMPFISRNQIREKNYLTAHIDKNSELDSISDVDTDLVIKEYETKLNILYPSKSLTEASVKDFNSLLYDREYQYDSNLIPNWEHRKKATSNSSSEPDIHEQLEVNDSNKITILDVDNNELSFDGLTSLYITNDNDEIIFKNNDVNNLKYTECSEKKSYTIKEGSQVRCRFLNSKLSKLFINTSNL